MDYYIGNAVYDFLVEYQGKHPFCWTSKDVWMLVYGNSDLSPRVLCLVSQIKEEHYLTSTCSDMEKGALSIMKQISDRSKVPLICIRFIENVQIEKVQFWKNGQEAFSELSEVELRNIFEEYNIELNEYSASKDINSKESSPYHIWQRNNLGNKICVSDIDLLRFEDNYVNEFIELKRSFIEIEKWEPYQNDYKNFVLLSNLANLANIDLTITYNHRVEKPKFFDDISKLKLFDFNTINNPKCRFLEYINMNQFIERKSKR